VTLAGKRVILAEDDRVMRQACALTLRRRGVEVVTAVDGEQALAAARSRAPDLLLLDMLMPKLSGLEVLQALRGEDATRGIPVLIMSNSSREQDMEEARRLGIIGYLVKANVSLPELEARVVRVLEGDAGE
jgi:DNA-binding response OmpR family regulator